MGNGYGSSYESGGVGGIVDLTTEVSGTLPVANGGTGATTLADNRVLTGTGTAAITAEANLTFTGSLLTVTGTAVITTSATVPAIYGSTAANGDLTLAGTSHATQASAYVLIDAAALTSDANDGGSLGISGVGWSDLFFATGAVIDYGAGNMAVTHATGTLAITGGSVGIGVTPLSVFHVNAATPTLTLSNSSVTITTGDCLGSLNFYSNDSSATSSGGVGGIRMFAEATYNTLNTPSYMAFYTHATSVNDASVFGTVTERMRIDSLGYLGLGVAPFSLLHISGATPILTIANSSTFVSAGDSLGALNFYSNDSSATSSGGVGGIRMFAETDYNTANTPSYMVFYTHGTSVNDASVLGTVTARMRLSSAGTLIIGADAAGTSAAGVLALSNSATGPSNSADLAHLYSQDCAGAGTAALCIYQEDAVRTAVAVVSTNSIPVMFNGTTYYLLATTVRS